MKQDEKKLGIKSDENDLFILLHLPVILRLFTHYSQIRASLAVSNQLPRTVTPEQRPPNNFLTNPFTYPSHPHPPPSFPIRTHV